MNVKLGLHRLQGHYRNSQHEQYGEICRTNQLGLDRYAALKVLNTALSWTLSLKLSNTEQKQSVSAWWRVVS
jgi:hypothetical protein